MSPSGRPHILVLEDEWMIAEQIVAALTDGGFEIVGPVGDVDQALALAAERPIDAAVLDINLHGQRSFEVAEILAKSATPFVFLSGYSEAELPAAFKDRPMLAKPVRSDHLRRSIEALITSPPGDGGPD